MLQFKNKHETYILFLILLCIAYTGMNYAVSDHLAGFSDDSATYLIMASIFSPFVEASQSFVRSFNHYYLPPGFPIVLSLFIGKGSIYASHCVVLLQALLACIIFFYLCKKINGTFNAFLTLLVFICLPGFWIQLLKIMPENQYIFFTLATILFCEIMSREHKNEIGHCLILGFFMSVCMLTRSIGISIFVAYIIYRLIEGPKRNCLVEITGVSIGFLIPFLCWKLSSPDVDHSYMDDIFKFVYTDAPFINLYNVILGNITGLYNGLIANISLVTAYQYDINNYILLFFLVSSAVGWLSRIKSLDGLYLLVYLAILFIWPYPEEMDRFIYPVMPLLIMYFFISINYMVKKIKIKSKKTKTLHILFFSILISSNSFGLNHIASRYKSGENAYGENVTNIVELYEIENEDEAITMALIWNNDLKIIKSLKGQLDKQAKLLAMKPQLITYLSDIYAEELPRITNGNLEGNFESWLTYIKNTKATHVVLSTIQLSDDKNEVDAIPYLSEFSETVMEYSYSANGKKQIFLSVLEVL